MKKGFTLVELMIVISMVGLLLAIAIPSCVNARKMSKVREQGIEFNTPCYYYGNNKSKAKVTKITQWKSEKDFRLRIEYADGLFFETVDPKDLSKEPTYVSRSAPKEVVTEKIVYVPLAPQAIDLRHEEFAIKANKTFDSDFDDFFHTQLKSEE